jgi:hypothetical protein
MIISSSSDVQWEDEKINRWNRKNDSLPSSIAKVYEDTRTGREKQYEHKPAIAETLFIQCMPDCNSCNGYIVIADSRRRYKCGCVHHSLSELDKSKI